MEVGGTIAGRVVASLGGNLEDDKFWPRAYTETGAIYFMATEASRWGFDTEEEADKAVAESVESDWAFCRNTYGSKDWGRDDEIGLMSERERAAKGVL